MTIETAYFSITLACAAGCDTENVFGYVIRIDTDASEACTNIAATLDATWTAPAIASGCGATLAETPLTLANLGNNAATDYPRRLVQGCDGADLTGTTGGDREMYFVPGQLTLTLAQGGACSDGAVVTGAVIYCNPDR